MNDLLNLSFLLEEIARKNVADVSFVLKSLLVFDPRWMRWSEWRKTVPAVCTNLCFSICKRPVAEKTNLGVDNVAKWEEDVSNEEIHGWED
jgi:hypothetical protein